MNPFRFLAALPAILGFGGFVIYLLLERSRTDDDVVKRIVEKLRRDVPDVTGDQRLNSKQLERLLEQDRDLRLTVGEQDYHLLKQILRQRFLASSFVSVIVVVLFGVTGYLYYRQGEADSRLALSDFAAVSTDSGAQGLLVDLDTIDVYWKSKGNPEDVQIYLENLDTHVHSAELSVPADAHRIQIRPVQYRPVLSTREKDGINRVRIVAQSKDAVFSSEPLNLYVGLTVLTLLDADRSLTVAAMIDNQRIPFYDFQAKVAVPSKSASGHWLVVGPEIPYHFKKILVTDPGNLNWADAKGVFLSPDDPRTVRFRFLVDDSFEQGASKINSPNDGLQETSEGSQAPAPTSPGFDVAIVFYNASNDPIFLVDNKSVIPSSYSSGIARFHLPQGSHRIRAEYANRSCIAIFDLSGAKSEPIPASCHLK